MKKVLFIVVVGLSTLLILLAAQISMERVKETATSDKPVVNTPVKLSAIVRLVRDGRTFCSGVVIDKTTILTASHCVISSDIFGGVRLNTAEIEIRAPDNRPLGVVAQVKPSAILLQLDRAILKGDFTQFEPAGYINDVQENVATRIKDNVFMSCGYPLGGKLFCTKTVFVSNYGFMMEVKGVLIPGMSGGPTFTSDGRVVALNIAVEGEFSIISPVYNVNDEK